ncbi:MAG: type III secretion system chaperone, partial [Sphingobacterium siyangense]
MTVKTKKLFVCAALFLGAANTLFAQTAGGTLGIDAATSSLTSYVDP